MILAAKRKKLSSEAATNGISVMSNSDIPEKEPNRAASESTTTPQNISGRRNAIATRVFLSTMPSRK
jgi:hypothetical protein